MSSSKKRNGIAPDKKVDPKVFSEADAERVARSIWGKDASSPFTGNIHELKKIMQSAANVYAAAIFELIVCEDLDAEWRQMRLFFDKVRAFRTEWENLPDSDKEEIDFIMESSLAEARPIKNVDDFTAALKFLDSAIEYSVVGREEFKQLSQRDYGLPKKVHVETHALRVVASDLKSKIEEFNSTPNRNKIKIARSFDRVEQKGTNDFSRLLLAIAKSIEPRFNASQCDSVMRNI